MSDEQLTEYYSKRNALYWRAAVKKDPGAQRRVARLLKLKDPAIMELEQETVSLRRAFDRKWGKCEARRRRLSYLRRSGTGRSMGRAPRRASNLHVRGSRRVTRAGPSSDDDPHEDDPDLTAVSGRPTERRAAYDAAR